MVAFAVGALFGLGLYAWWRRMDGPSSRNLPIAAKICLPFALALSVVSVFLAPTSAVFVVPLIAMMVAAADITYLAAMTLKGSPAPKQ